MSGLMPNVCEPHRLPVRPKPQITSSAMNSISYLSVTRWIFSKYPAGGHEHAARTHHGLGNHRRDGFGSFGENLLL